MSDAIKPGLPEGFSGGAIRAGEPSREIALVKPRVWPALIIIALQWAALLLPARLAPGEMAAFYGFMFGTYFGLGGVLLWWLFGSRVVGSMSASACSRLRSALPRFSYWGTSRLSHGRVSDHRVCCAGGDDGDGRLAGRDALFELALACAGMIVAIGAVCVYYGSLRLDGMNGVFQAAWCLRWKITDEDRFIAERGPQPVAAAKGDDVEIAIGGSRGRLAGLSRRTVRDGVYRAGLIETDWKQHPPKLLWKHRVGPGWSSFAMIGDRFSRKSSAARTKSSFAITPIPAPNCGSTKTRCAFPNWSAAMDRGRRRRSTTASFTRRAPPGNSTASTPAPAAQFGRAHRPRFEIRNADLGLRRIALDRGRRRHRLWRRRRQSRFGVRRRHRQSSLDRGRRRQIVLLDAGFAPSTAWTRF